MTRIGRTAKFDLAWGAVPAASFDSCRGDLPSASLHEGAGKEVVSSACGDRGNRYPFA